MYKQLLEQRKNQYYIRATLIIQSSDWKFIRDEHTKLKNKFSIPLHKEFKWHYLWNLKKTQKKPEPISEKRPYYFLRNHNLDALLEYADSFLGLLTELNYCKIIITVTDNTACPRINEFDLLKMHVQDLMQKD